MEQSLQKSVASKPLINKSIQKRAIINISGVRYEVLWSTLARLPQTRLGRLQFCTTHEQIKELCDDYDLEKNEFFFEKTPNSFETILNYYQTGKLHSNDNICVLSFSDDLEYWGIDEFYLEPCCHHAYYSKKEQIFEDLNNEMELMRSKNKDVFFGASKWSLYRQFLWGVLEKPTNNFVSKVYLTLLITDFITNVFTLLATLLLILESMSSFSKYANVLDTLETICTTWFTVEYIFRFVVLPHKCKFLFSFLNIIDLLVIVPFWISLIIENLNLFEGELSGTRNLFQALKVMRILRVLKIARHSKDLQSLGFTLKHSFKELCLLLLFMAIGILIFSSMAYYAEKDQLDTLFKSIPETFWWACITMTTVGYGDMHPTTTFGKIIGAFCCICGVLVLALPIPIIVNNFTEFYKTQMRCEKTMQRKQSKLTEIKKNKTKTKIHFANLRHSILRTTLLEKDLEDDLLKEIRQEQKMLSRKFDKSKGIFSKSSLSLKMNQTTFNESSTMTSLNNQITEKSSLENSKDQDKSTCLKKSSIK